MALNKKTLAGLALAAVVVVGGAVAYQTTAFSGENCSAGKAETTSGTAKAGCCAAKASGEQASAKTGDATVIPVGAGAACASKTGAMQASGSTCTKATEASAMQAGASCASKTGAMQAGASCPSGVGAECGGCDLYKTHWTSLEKASFKMNSVANGITITFASDDPAVLADLVKYANAKAEMYRSMAKADAKPAGCGFCQEKSALMKNATFAINNDTKSVTTTITGMDETTIAGLHKLATAQESTTQAATTTAKVEG